MTDNKMINAIGDVNDKYLNEATNYQANKVTKFKGWKVLGTVAAAACILVGTAVYQYDYNYAVDSIVEIDVNPSIKLKLSKAQKVLDVEALNEDGEVVLESIKFKGEKLDKVVTDIMDAIVDNGYMDDAEYSVNVRVENKNADRGNKLGDKLTDEIKGHLDKKDMIGNVNTQITEADDEAVEAAKSYNVSVAKYLLAKQVSETTGMAIEEAVLLSIGELWDLTDAQAAEIISKADAISIACDHAGVAVDAVTVLKNKITEIEGIYTYNIQFKTNDNIWYKYKIDGVSGAVVEYDHKEFTVKDDIKDENDREDKENNKGENKEEAELVKLLSKKEVLSILCDDAGVLLKDIRLEEFDVEHGDVLTYFVEFYVGLTEYQYVINATDGTIVEKTVTDLEDILPNRPGKDDMTGWPEHGDGAGKPEQGGEAGKPGLGGMEDMPAPEFPEIIPGLEDEDDESESDDTVDKPEFDDAENKPGIGDLGNMGDGPQFGGLENNEQKNVLSEEEVLNIVLTEAGVTEDEVTNLKISFKGRKLTVQFIISFTVDDTTYSYVVDGVSGEILSADSDNQFGGNMESNKPNQGDVPEMPDRGSDDSGEGGRPRQGLGNEFEGNENGFQRLN